MQDLEEFLRSSATTVEWVSDTLRSELNVPTGLETVIRAAVEQDRSVVIAGTAGSGKTHLLRTLSVPSGYLVVSDLAAHPESDWGNLFRPGHRVIVAGNEGAFLQGKHKKLAGFDQVIDLLHSIQRGGDPSGDGPTVIDAAGFDPAGSHVIARMLQLPLLRRFLANKAQDLASAAWEMLQDEQVTRRVAVLVEAASAESETDGFTFRQLWQFIADLALASIERDEPWFNGMFAGRTEVSRRILATFSPVTIPLPHIGNRLWHGDLVRVGAAFLDCARPILERLTAAIAKEQTDPAKFPIFESLRILAAFGLKNSPFEKVLNRGVDLWARVRVREALPLLQAVNRYFAFSLIEIGDDLELWLQHETERRLIKPEVQISLGTARANDFAIRRSHVIANRPDGVEQIEGGRLLLVHVNGATLFVTKDLVDGVLRPRSHRTNERRDVEYDWRIARFFERVAAGASRPDRLMAARFDFQARTARLMVWQIGLDRIRKVAA